MSTISQAELKAIKERQVRLHRRRNILATLEGYLYLAPTLIGLTLFVFIPIYTSFKLSLNRVAPFGGRMIYVGLDNFRNLISNPSYWDTVRVTFLFVLGTVPTGLILAVILAIALAYPLNNLSWLHRTMIFVPVVISSAVTGVLFKWLFHPVVGYINYLDGADRSSGHHAGRSQLAGLKNLGLGGRDHRHHLAAVGVST